MGYICKVSLCIALPVKLQNSVKTLKSKFACNIIYVFRAYFMFFFTSLVVSEYVYY